MRFLHMTLLGLSVALICLASDSPGLSSGTNGGTGTGGSDSIGLGGGTAGDATDDLLGLSQDALGTDGLGQDGLGSDGLSQDALDGSMAVVRPGSASTVAETAGWELFDVPERHSSASNPPHR